MEVKNRELARKNRLADLGQMASHVAHEVRNNLVPVSLYLSLLRRRIAEDRENTEVLDMVETGLRALDTEDESRRREHGDDGVADALLKGFVRFGISCFGNRHEPIQRLRIDRPAERFGGEAVQN